MIVAVEGDGSRTRLPRPGAGRRRSLTVLGVLLAVLVAGQVARVGLAGGWRQVASVRALSDAGVIYLPNLEVFVVQDEGRVVGLSARVPGLDRRVLYCARAERFVEADGAEFDRRGRYLEGPARRGLDRVATRVRSGLVEIDPEAVSPGPPRTVPADPGKVGPSCEVPGPERPPGFAAAPAAAIAEAAGRPPRPEAARHLSRSG